MSAEINPQKLVRDVIVVGASAGGIRAVIEVLSRLPADLPAFIGVVIHRGAATSEDWSRTLGGKTKLQVVEPSDGDSLTRGVVYVAPADCHMSLVQKPSEAEHASMPAYAIAKDHVAAALTVDEIGDALALLARGQVVAVCVAEQIAK